MYDQSNPIPPVLPRSAWESPTAHFRAIFKAKKALDEIERVHNNRVPDDQSIPAIPGGVADEKPFLYNAHSEIASMGQKTACQSD